MVLLAMALQFRFFHSHGITLFARPDAPIFPSMRQYAAAPHDNTFE
jgi:hypothetical protein